ncbi:MAG: N-acetylglucosamine-6-phosphate deacetylase [Candidatus Pristimantibacillus lignocellulolyticus]|uniref:N-acetylglucosamine-6-phosphate deacetylase n=1 Tax=Candidatus Pristimantibacillus lignocellulolyticus TaxID=2994561 RepID=A0A9J6Z8L8_9BACL|nr:MAG: N-acetylglucosamine-6-phosphate deacetylase [Candidatus Pristimantibacillus lignocellulolyticus]
MDNIRALLITNANIVLPDRLIEDGWIYSCNGEIVAYGNSNESYNELIGEEAQKVDGKGGYVLPGFIDIHVHGGANHDFMTAKDEELDTITRFHMENGTTTMLATTVTASRDELTEVIDTVAKYERKPMPYAQLIGVHLEGPFVNPKWKGAQNDNFMVAPQLEWLDEWVQKYPGVVKIQTLAPEIEGAPQYIRALKDHGIVAACGHTDATFEEIEFAVEHGLSHAVHTFNAMRALHHREPGTVGAVMLNDNITAEVIADGHHVHPAAIKILLQAKGADLVVLVTDAMSAAGMPDGEYLLGVLPVIVEDGTARLKEGGSLAGSTLTMIKGFQYLIQEVGVSIIEASRIASLNPARVIGISQQYGSLEVGKRADLLLVDKGLSIDAVFIAGEQTL